MIRIAVDAMGGDKAPQVVLEGVEAALAARDDLEVVLVGDAEVVDGFAASRGRVEAIRSTQVIAMDEHPAEAVRAKPDASVVVACKAVRQGEAQGLFSAGSTGALLTAATLRIGRIKGIKRPALAAVLPGLAGGSTVFCDLGANADCRADMVTQFAFMGSLLAQVELGVEKPRVALLSNGTEDTKGSTFTQECFASLSGAAESGLIDFQGNCEGTDILRGAYDVVVSDGFTGNVALKSIEGTAKFMAGRLKELAASSPRAAVGALLVKPAFKEVAAELSGDAHGGAHLMGLKAPVVKGHGSSSAEAVKNGILVAARAVSDDLCGRLAETCRAAAL